MPECHSSVFYLEEFLQTPFLSSSISFFIRTTCTPPFSLPYHSPSSSSSHSSLIMGFAPAVCFNKGWREHTKGGVDQKRGESQGHRRGNLPCFSFCPPLSGFFHFPKSFFYIPKFLSSPLLSSLSLDPFGTLSKYFFPGESFPAFSVPGCNMSANFLCEGVEKPLNFVSIILSLWQIFKNPSTHIGILGKCVTLHLFVAFTFAFTKCE